MLYLLLGKVIMHDPFAMRPFFGYNCGDYMAHWLKIQKQTVSNKLPKIYHVNWFRKNSEGKFIWPGFGENSRVLDWICRRIEGEATAIPSPIGYLPATSDINLEGLQDPVDMKELFSLPKDFWQQEVKAIEKYFQEQLPNDLPEEISQELKSLEARINQM